MRMSSGLTLSSLRCVSHKPNLSPRATLENPTFRKSHLPAQDAEVTVFQSLTLPHTYWHKPCFYMSIDGELPERRKGKEVRR